MHKFVMVLENHSFSQGMNRYFTFFPQEKSYTLTLLTKKNNLRKYPFDLFLSQNRCISQKFIFSVYVFVCERQI